MNNEDYLKSILETIKEQTKEINTQIWRDESVAIVVMKRELQRSADYVEKNMPNVTYFTSGYKPYFYNFVPSKVTLEGHIAEFGVWKGESINYLAKLFNPKVIWGFDSFFGLEEDFSIDYLKGGFNENGNTPLVENNVSLVKGSFSESLPTWLEQHPGVFSFINIDCDTYQATSTVLNLIGPKRIVSGTVILFDEYIGFAGWKNHEFKAWQEYCNTNNVKYTYIAINHMQVLLQVL